MCALLYLGEDTKGKIIALLLSEPGPVTEPLCASVSSFEVGLRTVAASKGCCEDSQNSCIETLRCGRYMHAWHLARAVIMITLAQVKVARVGVWKRGGSVLANYPMLRPPNCPEI